MMLTCKRCGTEWDELTLLTDGWSYLSITQAEQLDVRWHYHMALSGVREQAKNVGNRVYNAVLRGEGCPMDDCGFLHD